MSVHRETSIHCDGCGNWRWSSDMTHRAARKAGWRLWTTGGGRYGHRLHLCPNCTETRRGERPPTHGGTDG